MSRSVSYANHSVWVLYAHLEQDDDMTPYCAACGETVEGAHQAIAVCARCGGREFRQEPTYPFDLAWEDFCANVRGAFSHAFPSLKHCDTWLGREDHALLENDWVHIGVSEYEALVSVWCVPKSQAQVPSFAEQWAASIEDRAARLLEQFAVRLRRLGTMSNGEGVFQRVEPRAR